MEWKHKTAALHNLGCKVNAYETEAMQQQLEKAGYEIVPFAPGADVYVINTCSVTNMADRKSRQMLHRAKKMNPDAVVVAVGCYVQTAADQTGLAVEADLQLGNNRKNELVPMLDEYFREKDGQKIRELSEIGKDRHYEDMFLTGTREHTRAFMKVQDGCNQFCSYCIIPYARGRVRSRSLDDAVREAAVLAENGVQEIVLTGSHLSSYGTDSGTDLGELIRRVTETDGIRRIRLGSLEPGIITRDFAAALSQNEKFCPHFHLSLQSGSNTVLRRMNRRYTAAEYAQKCEMIREYFRDPAVTTDVIVGFPGETEEEFLTTRHFLDEIGFYETHIFKYSKRKGTRAAVMTGQVPEEIKTERSDILIADSQRRIQQFEERWLGREAEVLFE